MKSHPRQCTPLNATQANPCTSDHVYLCKGCGAEFTTNASTLYTSPTARETVYATRHWPFHNLDCRANYIRRHPDYTYRSGEYHVA